MSFDPLLSPNGYQGVSKVLKVIINRCYNHLLKCAARKKWHLMYDVLYYIMVAKTEVSELSYNWCILTGGSSTASTL